MHQMASDFYSNEYLDNRSYLLLKIRSRIASSCALGFALTGSVFEMAI